MWGGDLLAIERPGKKFLCCHVGMMYMTIRVNGQTKEELKKEADRLYNLFDRGDPGEFELSLDEIKTYKKCDCALIIPTTRDKFVDPSYKEIVPMSWETL